MRKRHQSKQAGSRPVGTLALVRRAPQGHASRHLGLLLLDGRAYPCALGKTGITGNKKEGDGATPRGFMRILEGRYRADRVLRPVEHGPRRQPFWQRIKTCDGWADEPFTPDYNRPVRLPSTRSHETMTRADGLYDRLIVLDWNITTRAQARGSAIFLHQARVVDGRLKPTLGCIALLPRDFALLAPRLAQLEAIHVL